MEKPTELETIKKISKTLNQGTEIEATLSTVLKSLLSITPWTTGWIFLIAEDGTYSLAARHQLAPALDN
ncbi:hypothetical protein [Alteribacillus sp. HJP-4]|uniref:hypothetical protein n=1 Tax=Alteribacillus sp. HJP-4 TaxID=2775394 RepID=UPI0035CCFAF2